MVLDAGLARTTWNWRPAAPLDAVLNEIAAHADEHPDWLSSCT
jgi:CDP-paratose 2-epimerase